MFHVTGDDCDCQDGRACCVSACVRIKFAGCLQDLPFPRVFCQPGMHKTNAAYVPKFRYKFFTYICLEEMSQALREPIPGGIILYPT